MAKNPINGKRSHLWRAVDQDGNVLDILVQSRRNKRAAKKVSGVLVGRGSATPADQNN